MFNFEPFACDVFWNYISHIKRRRIGWVAKNANEPFILCNIPSFENSVAKRVLCAVPFQYWELRLQSATKWVETLRPKLDFFYVLLTSKGGNIAFPPPSPPCNVVPMFELLVENNEHPTYEWRGQGRGADSFVLWSYPIWVQCLNNFVADLGFRKKDMHSFLRGALSKSQNWPAGPVISDNEIGFFKEFF